jgi:hypothetical protein
VALTEVLARPTATGRWVTPSWRLDGVAAASSRLQCRFCCWADRSFVLVEEGCPDPVYYVYRGERNSHVDAKDADSSEISSIPGSFNASVDHEHLCDWAFSVLPDDVSFYLASHSCVVPHRRDSGAEDGLRHTDPSSFSRNGRRDIVNYVWRGERNSHVDDKDMDNSKHQSPPFPDHSRQALLLACDGWSV